MFTFFTHVSLTFILTMWDIHRSQHSNKRGGRTQVCGLRWFTTNDDALKVLLEYCYAIRIKSSSAKTTWSSVCLTSTIPTVYCCKAATWWVYIIHYFLLTVQHWLGQLLKTPHMVCESRHISPVLIRNATKWWIFRSWWSTATGNELWHTSYGPWGPHCILGNYGTEKRNDPCHSHENPTQS